MPPYLFLLTGLTTRSATFLIAACLNAHFLTPNAYELFHSHPLILEGERVLAQDCPAWVSPEFTKFYQRHLTLERELLSALALGYPLGQLVYLALLYRLLVRDALLLADSQAVHVEASMQVGDKLRALG